MSEQRQQTTRRSEFVPFVSIIIPVYNGKRTLHLCLDAIQALDYPKDRHEVIVVDNNSTDGTPGIVSQYPVRLVYERQIQGPHAATNTGVQQARGEILAFTDSDCVPEPGWLRALVAPFADENIVATGGRIEAYQPSSRVERFIQHMEPLKNCLRLSESFPVSIITANAAYRANAFRATGMFNPNMYTGAEVDLAWRLQLETGKQVVYVPEAVIYHMFSSSLGQMFRHQHIYGYADILLDTIYRDVPSYPRTPAQQLGMMLSQIRAMVTYLASFVYRSLTGPLRGRDADYVLWPALWLVAESGSLYGKLRGIWLTRFFRKQFWADRPRAI